MVRMGPRFKYSDNMKGSPMVSMLKRIIGVTGFLAVTLTVPVAASAAPAGAAGTAPRCTTNRLAITAGQDDGAAGTLYLPLYFTNTSSKACVIYGYPRVAYVTAPHGQQVNNEAVPDVIGTPQHLTLVPTARAVAVLRMPQAGNYDEETCRPVPVAGIRVAPPADRTTVFIGHPNTVCSVNGIAEPGIRALELA